MQGQRRKTRKEKGKAVNALALRRGTHEMQVHAERAALIAARRVMTPTSAANPERRKATDLASDVAKQGT